MTHSHPMCYLGRPLSYGLARFEVRRQFMMQRRAGEKFSRHDASTRWKVALVGRPPWRRRVVAANSLPFGKRTSWLR